MSSQTPSIGPGGATPPGTDGAREGASTDDHPAEIADRVAEAALSVPGVDSLHGGAFGEAATYLPGRRVAGVRLTDNATEVHVVLRLDAPVLQTADRVRDAISPLVGGRVDVVVEDVVEPAALPED